MTENRVKDYRLISEHDDLVEIAESFSKEKILAVDLEADSMYHFKEKVCLLQMASAHENVVIDPLLLDDFSPLKPVFENPNIRKVFHGSDYDIRSLYRDFGISVENLFDTELASRFLGVRESGLASVVNRHFEVALEKKYQKKDWSVRPLPQEMLDYSAGDVEFLLPLEKILREGLEEKGREHWVAEECKILSGVRPAQNNGDPMFLRFKGAGRLKRRDLAVLEEVLIYRCTLARKRDKPMYKIFGNSTILEIVKRKPETCVNLKLSRLLSDKQFAAYGSGIAASVAKAMAIPENDLPRYPRKRCSMRLPAVSKRIKVLKEWRDDLAERLDLDPSLVFNKAQLSAIAVKNPECPEDLNGMDNLRNWQKFEFGSILPELLKNRSYDS